MSIAARRRPHRAKALLRRRDMLAALVGQFEAASPRMDKINDELGNRCMRSKRHQGSLHTNRRVQASVGSW
jgi:hypothetical protein